MFKDFIPHQKHNPPNLSLGYASGDFISNNIHIGSWKDLSIEEFSFRKGNFPFDFLALFKNYQNEIKNNKSFQLKIRSNIKTQTNRNYDVYEEGCLLLHALYANFILEPLKRLSNSSW